MASEAQSPDKMEGDYSDGSVPLKSTESMSHQECLQFFQESIKALVSIDPILQDLRPDVTLDEVKALIALENGQAMTVFIDRESCSPWKVVVAREATVHQLKLALKHHVTLSLDRRNNLKKISWKYIWRTYWLVFDNIKLEDGKKLVSYGIHNKARLSFVKKMGVKKRPPPSSVNQHSS